MPKELDFTFYNVGQGLFYTGKIGSFNFVYDCGSTNRKHLNKAIESHKEEIANHFNLIILSHFHHDHISGIQELLSNRSVGQIILPYFTPIERLIIALHTPEAPEWYYQFLSDPVSYLIDTGKVNRIIIIGGKDEDKKKNQITPPKKSDYDDLDLNKMPEDEELWDVINKEDSQWNSLRKHTLFVKNHRGIATVYGFWVFKFFNYKLEETKKSDFEDCLKDKKITIHSKNLRDVIVNKDIRDKLKSCYGPLDKDLNNTSLVVYHGLIKKRGGYRVNYLSYGRKLNPHLWNDTKSFNHRNKKIGQFLTGDIDLNPKWTDLKNHFIEFLRDTTIIQIPHHGARKNWNSQLLGEVRNESLWCVSAGISNKYEHPNIEVVDEIIDNGKCVVWSNEHNKIVIKGRLYKP